MDAAGSTCLDERARGAEESENEDVQLVERVRAHDTVAFDILVKKYRERLYSVIYNMTANKEDASDLTQDSFIKAFQSINKFHGKSAFYTWLYRIAVNTALSFIRKNKVRRFFSFEKIQEDGLEAICEQNNIFEKNGEDRSIFLKELQEKLNIALQKLSNKHRVVVILHEIEGLDHAAIAGILKCSEGTVRSRLHYAKEQLKGFLKEYM